MLLLLAITSITFSLFGFIIGIWATNFEKLQLIPLIIITPLVFLGGSFYSIDMLPSAWQVVSMFNPAMYLISGFRWAFFGVSEVPIQVSFLAVMLFAGLFLGIIAYIFKTGYRLRN